MEREACVCDHGYERSDLCAEIIIIIIIITYLLYITVPAYSIQLAALSPESQNGDALTIPTMESHLPRGAHPCKPLVWKPFRACRASGPPIHEGGQPPVHSVHRVPRRQIPAQ